MKVAIFYIVLSALLFANEAVVSYSKECKQDVLNLEHKTIDSIYFGHLQDKSEYLDKNGIIELKMGTIDLLCIQSSSFDKIGIKKDKLQDYNLKILQENSNFILISRSKWFESLPSTAKNAILAR